MEPTCEHQFEAILKHEHPWSVKDIGSNSISSMLLDSATLSSASFLLSSKTLKGMDSIPVIATTAIRKVRIQEFEPYLASILEVINKYQLHKALGNGALEGILNLETELEDDFEERIAQLIPMKATKGVIDKPNRTRMLSSAPNSWQDIPKLFDDKKFDLSNPHTFSAVVEYKDVIGLNSVDEELMSKTLQNKLTLYLDTIEVKLLKEISRRSASFFAALKNLQELQIQTEESIHKIAQIRDSLSIFRNDTVKRNLQVVRYSQKKKYSIMVYNILKVVENAKDSKPLIEVLINQSDYVGALNMIEEIGIALHGLQIIPDSINASKLNLLGSDNPTKEQCKSMDLVGLLKAELGHSSSIVASKLECQFVDALIRDAKAQFDNNPTTNIQKQDHATRSMNNILSEEYDFSNTALLNNIEHLSIQSPHSSVLKDVIKPTLIALLRMGKLEQALKSYGQLLSKEIQLYSRQFYPRSDAIKQNNLFNHKNDLQAPFDFATRLKSMTFDAFYATLIKLFIFFLKVLQRTLMEHEMITSIIKEAEMLGVDISSLKLYKIELVKSKIEVKSDIGNSDEYELDIDIPPRRVSEIQNDKVVNQSQFSVCIDESWNVLCSTTDFTHNLCAKLIAVRSEQNSKLNPKDFYRLFNATWEFLSCGEKICGKPSFGLKSSILSQAKLYVNYFHEEKSKQIAILLDNEQWMQADIPIDFHEITEQLKTKSFFASPSTEILPLNNNIHDDSNDDLSTSYSRPGRASNDSIATPSNSVSTRYLIVDGMKYFAVGSVLLFLKMLTDYVQCAKNFPTLTTEILSRIYEFLKVSSVNKLFNSRTCQLILGGGAVKSAGLRGITAKHITLTSQSLGLVMAVIPYIRIGLSTLLLSNQQVLLSDFDRITGDYRDHQNELYMHLVNIMVDRLGTHSSHLVAINWDGPDQKDFSSDGISVPMSILTTETIVLHKVLYKYLPPQSLKSILHEVFRSYTRKLEDEFKKIDLFSSWGKSKLLSDVHYLIERLSSLDGVDGPGSHLEEFVNNIKIKDKKTYHASKIVPTSEKKGPGPSIPVAPPPQKTAFAYTFGKMLRNQNDG